MIGYRPSTRFAFLGGGERAPRPLLKLITGSSVRAGLAIRPSTRFGFMGGGEGVQASIGENQFTVS